MRPAEEREQDAEIICQGAANNLTDLKIKKDSRILYGMRC